MLRRVLLSLCAVCLLTLPAYPATFPHTFAPLTGNVPLSYLDDNFNALINGTIPAVPLLLSCTLASGANQCPAAGTRGRLYNVTDVPGIYMDNGTALIRTNFVMAEWFPGSDIGAKINAAIAAGATKIYVSTAGTLSTPIDPPMRTVIDFAPNIYYITATSPLSHRNVILEFNGSTLETNVSSGPIFDVGKLATVTPGTVNTSGTAVTWVSGPYFTDIDDGDSLIIAGTQYTVLSVNSATSITLTGSAGSQSSAAYSAIMFPENPTSNYGYFLGVDIRDANFHHATGTGDAIRGTFSWGLRLRNIGVTSGYTYALDCRGCIQLKADLISGGSPVLLTDYTAAGFATGSNSSSLEVTVQGATTSPTARVVDIENSGGIDLPRIFLEGNSVTSGLWIGYSSAVHVASFLFEKNGDGTSNASDIYLWNSTDIRFGTGQCNAAGGTFNNAGSCAVVYASTASFDTLAVTGYGTSYAHAITTAGGGLTTVTNYLTSGLTGSDFYNIQPVYARDSNGNVTVSSLTLNGAQIGVATTPPFNAGNFSGSGGMTWTVTSGEVIDYSYTVTGKIETVFWQLNGTTVGGTLNPVLNMTIPGGNTAANNTAIGVFSVPNNGNWQAAGAAVTAGNTYISLYVDPTEATNWTASSAVYLKGQITFPIQ
jgi:hypothetical protein